MTIGEASKASGVSTKMIRYYEAIGLIGAASRTTSGYRTYGENDVHTLRFVSRARDLGFSVEQMGGLLALWRDRNRASADVKTMALDHIKMLEDKVRSLKSMIGTLKTLADTCHGDGRPECPIIENFASEKPAPRKHRQARFGVADVAPDRARS